MESDGGPTRATVVTMVIDVKPATYIKTELEGLPIRTKPDSRKHDPTKLDVLIESFAANEAQSGVKECTIHEHSRMIRVAMRALKAKRKDVTVRRITANDLEYVRKEMEFQGVKSPVSYARILALFVSYVTGEPPLIDTGSYGRPIRNEALLLSDPVPGQERRTLGGKEDRTRIEARWKAEFDGFSKKEGENGLNPRTRTIHRKHLCAAVFVAEHELGAFDPGAITAEDLDRMDSFIQGFGVADPGRYTTLLSAFVSYVTGNEPLRDIQRQGRPKGDWRIQYDSLFPFEKELEEYRNLIEARDLKPEGIESRIGMVRLGVGIAIDRFGIKRLEDITADIIKGVEGVLKEHLSVSAARQYKNELALFASYRVGPQIVEDLRRRPMSERYRRYIPDDDTDTEFAAALDSWIEDLEKWRYRPHTINSRVTVAITCYRKLKEAKGTFELRELDPHDILLLRDYLAGYRESTVQNYLCTFGWFLKFAIGRNLYQEAHVWFNGIPIDRQFLTDEEFAMLYRAGGPLERLILSLGATMGIRMGEMLSIRLEDIHSGTMHLKGKGAGPDGKGMEVAISSMVLRDLKVYMEHRTEVVSRYGDRSTGILLVNESSRSLGMPLERRAFQIVLDNLCEKADMRFVSHALRRMFAMKLVDSGTDLDTTRRMMRHECLETTLKCYIQADPRKTSAARKGVDTAFSGLGLRTGITAGSPSPPTVDGA